MGYKKVSSKKNWKKIQRQFNQECPPRTAEIKDIHVEANKENEKGKVESKVLRKKNKARLGVGRFREKSYAQKLKPKHRSKIHNLSSDPVERKRSRVCGKVHPDDEIQAECGDPKMPDSDEENENEAAFLSRISLGVYQQMKNFDGASTSTNDYRSISFT